MSSHRFEDYLSALFSCEAHMQHEDRFRLVQERAYDLYLHRNPEEGSPEEDWHKAEQQIEQEESQPSIHVGPARLRDKSHWGAIGSHAGEDLENPA